MSSISHTAQPLTQTAFKVSNNPAIRMQQAESFWRRNPGWEKTNGVADALRGVARKTPLGAKASDTMQATEFGVGQALLDQMGWQVRTTRQPDNVWWMGMNARLVGDGITGEAYVRAGRQAEVTAPNIKAWVDYVERSDAIKRAMGHPVGRDFTVIGAIDRPGAVTSTALSDAWKGVSLLERARVELQLKPAARHAY